MPLLLRKWTSKELLMRPRLIVLLSSFRLMKRPSLLLKAPFSPLRKTFTTRRMSRNNLRKLNKEKKIITLPEINSKKSFKTQLTISLNLKRKSTKPIKLPSNFLNS